ncbi:hypothetical protein Goari_004528 [Gossypium aridum]|uniref:Uncharacterized protein n=1 Tax=Gossypium aridum TaxID=34290 RepID=A0A7J8Y3Q3_GOSAI|nr:hypothetical protein [Gossypium aridum]
MEVLMGPTFAIDVAASAAAYTRDRSKDTIPSPCLFIKDDEACPGSDARSPDLSSDSSSSIGSPGDSDVEEEDDGVVSSGESKGLSFDALEDSLPIKRGLSNHYVGKSKSFANLSDINSVKELQKVESPFNKRRRLLLANKWSTRSRKSSFYSWQNPNSMPLLALVEDDEDTDNNSHNKQTPSSSPPSLSSSSSEYEKITSTKPKLQQSNLRASFKSQSCLSLTDLHVQVDHQ